MSPYSSFNDDEWIARANAVDRPSPITRVKAPKAHVVVISGPAPKPAGASQKAPAEPIRERLEEVI